MGKSNQNIRVVNSKTGAVSENIALYANDPVWQKRTGNYPQPAPKAESFKAQNPEIKQNNVSRDNIGNQSEEIKTNINEEKSKTVTDGRVGNPASGSNSASSPAKG